MDKYNEWEKLSKQSSIEEFFYHNSEFPRFDYEPFQRFYVAAIRQAEKVIIQTAGSSYDDEIWNETRQKLKDLSSESSRLRPKSYKLTFVGEDVDALADFMSQITEIEAHIPYKIEAKIEGKYYARIFPEEYSALQSIFVDGNNMEIIDKINEELEKFEPRIVPRDEVE